MNAWAVLWGSRTQPLDDYGMLILVSGEEGIENRQRERKGYKKRVKKGRKESSCIHLTKFCMHGPCRYGLLVQ